MRHFDLHRSVALACTLAAALIVTAGCGAKDKNGDAGDSAVVEADTASVEGAPSQATATPPAQSTSAPLTVADIERWQRGMEAELRAVQDASGKMKSAKNAEDTAKVIYSVNDMSTRDAGASAAGLDPERYQFVRTTLSSAVAQLSPLEMEMKIDQMPASMVEELKKGRITALERMADKVPAEVVEALRPSAAALRKQDMTLTGERLKAAGIGR